MYNIHRWQHFPACGLVVQLYVVDLTCFSHTTKCRWRECTAVYYTSVLAKLRKHIAKKQPQLQRAGWRLHDHNIRPHVANYVMQFLAKFNITCVPHPPYSPNLAPCDFFLFDLRSLKQGSRKVRRFSRSWQRMACVMCSRNDSNSVRSAFN